MLARRSNKLHSLDLFHSTFAFVNLHSYRYLFFYQAVTSFYFEIQILSSINFLVCQL